MEPAQFSFTFPAHSVTSMKLAAPRSNRTTSHLFANAGWHLIGLPLDPIDPSPEAVFVGIPIDARLYRYDNTTCSYVAYSSAAPGAFGNIHAGQGYWLWLDQPATVQYEGYDAGAIWSTPIRGKGWHLIGQPHETGTPILGLTANGTHMANEAYLDLPAWGWAPSGYFTAGRDPWESSTLDPWHGYWAYALADEFELTVPNEAWP
jgi:hypothetical protein